ncbi:DNA polymerase Y family protein [Nocardioides sp. ChNu-153]|uniref:DNA polymerase Y family protein n=1 Tax=Nocardioides sp. ChNu-153 TaxID=2779364 RepID=UPI0026553FD1|nr:DNA polymerase Y family protein [Nocardioides sp. ChNu-153]MDN7122136.1 DNA polymerase Y family protein [Nocardioides sp. ChNu-153]
MAGRVLVVWCPDWSVVAALAEEELSLGAPAAVLSRNVVEVCNGPARDEGVRRGMRRRDAQSRCPELVLLDANPERDARAFETVLGVVEEVRPGVAPLRPGLLALRAPGRYGGGEPHAAALLAETLVGAGVWDVRIGVADDLFTAEQAARRAGVQEHVVVGPGESAVFLRSLPVDALLADPAAEELVSLLRRLGLRTLGDLGALPAADVGRRFGTYGAEVHRRVRGEGEVALAARTPPPELAREVPFEPPLESVEAICFSVRTTAERFVAGLAERQLVATAVRVEASCAGAHGEDVVVSARSWLHPRHFSARDLVDRVHWQLQGQSQGSVRSRRAAGPVLEPVTRVRFVPETAEPAAAHAEALWGGGADELVGRGMARVQAMLGYDAVLVPVAQGGRGPAARQAAVPWGERPVGLRAVDRPWPGRIPGPAPARVFAEPLPGEVHDASGVPVRVDDRGWVTGEPTTVRVPDAGWLPVDAWAGPWPVDEAWWEETGSPVRRAARFQVVGVDGRAWLMACVDGAWWVEAGYD